MTRAVDVTRVIAGGAAVAAATVGAAGAQDIGGFYGGVSFGLPGGSILNDGDEYSYSGSSSGLFAGYNVVQGDWVLGGEIGYVGTLGTEEAESGDAYEAQLGPTVDLKARVGRVFGRTLVYGSVGYAKSRVDWDGAEVDLDGATFGLGVETGIGSNGFVGMDYTKYNLDGDFAGYFDDVTFSNVSIRAGFRF